MIIYVFLFTASVSSSLAFGAESHHGWQAGSAAFSESARRENPKNRTDDLLQGRNLLQPEMIPFASDVTQQKAFISAVEVEDNRMSRDRRNHRRRRGILDKFQSSSEKVLYGIKNTLTKTSEALEKVAESARLKAIADRAEKLQWYSKYYDCLRLQRDEQLLNIAKPAGLVGTRFIQANDRIKLECKTCLPPGKSAAGYGVRWMRRLGNIAGEFQEVPSTSGTFEMDPNGDLHIRDIQPEDAGLYTCFKYTSNEATFYIEVIPQETRKKVYVNSKDGPLPSGEKLLMKNNLMVYTEWSDWSDCNKCGLNGERRRVGDCKVKKYTVNEPVQPNSSAVLDHWSGPKGGLFCRSSLMPRWIAEMNVVNYRANEIMMEHCYQECVTLPVQQTFTDAMGNVLEVVEVAKGFRSVAHDTPPSEKPPIARSLVFVDVNKRLILRCPDLQSQTTKLLRWLNQSTPIDPQATMKNTKGRVYVDSMNQLVIQRVMYQDKGYYSCWIYLRHVATIRVRVTGYENMTYLGFISYAGVFAMFAVPLVMCCRLCWLQCSHHKDMR